MKHFKYLLKLIVQDFKKLFSFIKTFNQLVKDLTCSKREQVIFNLIIILLIIGVIDLFCCGQKYTTYANLYYCIAGSLISIIISMIFEMRKRLQESRETLISRIYLLKDCYNISREIFLDFFSHPLDDLICKQNKNNIIYVNPVCSGLYLDIDKLHKYSNFIKNLDEETFKVHFREKETRFLIERLKLKTGWLNSLQITALSIQNSLDKVFLSTFLQFIGSIWNLININDYKWQDSQVKNMLYTSIKITIPLHCSLLEQLQKLILQHDSYLDLQFPKSRLLEYLERVDKISKK